MLVYQKFTFKRNKDENVHSFPLSAIRVELLERMKEREREKDSFGMLYTGYILYIVKIMREMKEREMKRL